MGPIGARLHRRGILPATDVRRCIERGVESAPPRRAGFHQRGKLELERFPERIDDEVEHGV